MVKRMTNGLGPDDSDLSTPERWLRLEGHYQRKRAKTNGIVATKTVAHKLARACFYILRDQVPFEVEKAFG